MLIESCIGWIQSITILKKVFLLNLGTCILFVYLSHSTTFESDCAITEFPTRTCILQVHLDCLEGQVSLDHWASLDHLELPEGKDHKGQEDSLDHLDRMGYLEAQV